MHFHLPAPPREHDFSTRNLVTIHYNIQDFNDPFFDPFPPPESVTIYSKPLGYTLLNGHPGTIVITVHGNCVINGYRGRHSSYGVFFGPRSRYNCGRLLTHKTDPQKSIHAELSAAIAALDRFEKLRQEGNSFKFNRVVFVTASSYTHGWMTMGEDWWMMNPWAHGNDDDRATEFARNLLKAGVKNYLHQGIEVLFWKVQPLLVDQAVQLSCRALRMGSFGYP